MITAASNELILALVDAAKMLIKGDVTMTPRQLANVRRLGKQFRKVVSPNSSVKQVRNVCQTGGFLPALIGPLLRIGLPILSGLFGGRR